MVWVHTIALTSSVAPVTTFRHVQIRVKGGGCGGCTCSSNHTGTSCTSTCSIKWILPI
ncbi:hypothetical protein HanIR_Chr04g0161771 [Helianthus annuus]|nr:hypothetical protein HanIR_Chr04g0161771 [Helianthus annuus]